MQRLQHESMKDCGPSTSGILEKHSLETGSGKAVDEFGLPDVRKISRYFTIIAFEPFAYR